MSNAGASNMTQDLLEPNEEDRIPDRWDGGPTLPRLPAPTVLDPD